MAHTLDEHLSYLALNGRFELFERAIEQVLRPGDAVADLGCGVGVLGIQCLNAGASKVYGIDFSDAIYIARETAERAGLGDSYQCIPGSTFASELPAKVDLLICDHVGYFGFDYGIVDMLRDAAKRMLGEGGRIIPDSIALTVAGVSSDECLGLASAWSEPVIPDEYRWLDSYGRNTKYRYEFDGGELCSKPVRLGEIELGHGDEELYSFSAEIEVTESGRFDGLAGWFDAHLGGDVWMTNSPLGAASIGRGQAFLPVEKPFDVREGDRIGLKLRASSDGKLIAWTIQPPQGSGPAQKMSTWASTILSEGDRRAKSREAARLTKDASAATLVLSLVDGERSMAEIEEIVLERHPDLKPTRKATRDFVQAVLGRNTET